MKRTAGYLVIACLVFAFGCAAPTELARRFDVLSALIAEAESAGAQRCAPRSLALAQAHGDFGRLELSRGELSRAEEHLRVAEPHALAARDGSPTARCVLRDDRRGRENDTDGDGIPNDQDRCPEEPEDLDASEDSDGCPEQEDADLDGIPDDIDFCPLQPEDVDGHGDEDGCPDIDDDVDGVVDTDDDCRREPEDMDGFEDEDGCPDLDNDQDRVPDSEDLCPLERGPLDERGCPRTYPGLRVHADHIELLQELRFDTGRARVSRASRTTAGSLAQVLDDDPQITLVIDVHTDATPRMSQRRAAALKDFLIEQGAPPARIVARGRRVRRGERATGVNLRIQRESDAPVP